MKPRISVFLPRAYIRESTDSCPVEREELNLGYHAAVVGWPEGVTIREVTWLVKGQRA